MPTTAIEIRKTTGRTEHDAAWSVLTDIYTRTANAALANPAIGNGGTAGRLRTTASISFAVKGALYTKASTDDLWNLSAQTATTGSQYRAFWLYLDSSGTASIAAGSNAASADLALAALPAVTTTKSVIGVFVAGPSTDFTAALAGQGTIYNGYPDAATANLPFSLVGA